MNAPLKSGTARKPTIAQDLAARVIDAPREFDKAVTHAVERLLLDSMACALGAAGSPSVIALRKWAQRVAGEPAAGIWGTAERSSVIGAALVNCTMTRDLDMNDTYFSHNPGHLSDNIGACIAVGEAEGSTTTEVMRAILIAFEVQMRACEFTRSSFFKTAGWDQTTFITPATAAAVGSLLKLNAGQLTNALAIAGSYPGTGEMRVGQISMMKSVSAGLAATRGIEAAYLAKEGVTGPHEVFEGQRGLGKLILGECDWGLLTAPFGDWRLPRTCLKRYPAAYIIHASIDATLALRAEHGIKPQDVKEVLVEAFGWLIEDMVNGMGGTSRYDIDARETADHSLPYCVAVSLVDGRYDIGQLNSGRWAAPEVRAMIQKVKCVHDKAMDARFPPDRPTRVTIVTNDGRKHVRELPYPKGDYREPFSDEELAAKFRTLSAAVLAPAEQECAIACALNFSRESVASLLQACMPGKR
ncbi:MAG: MmgE/PrpD family protein [Burkholderiales bacterium]